jgi:glycosyltransferase involved in cell wall biosynthesis
MNVHYCDFIGGIYYPDGSSARYIMQTTDQNVNYVCGCIRHYVTKSLEEFVDIKWKRRGNGSSKTRLNKEFYFKYNKKTEEKSRYFDEYFNKVSNGVQPIGNGNTQHNTITQKQLKPKIMPYQQEPPIKSQTQSLGNIDYRTPQERAVCPGANKTNNPAIKHGLPQKSVQNDLSVSEYPFGVSVCISAWKTAEYIEECLDSVAAQTWFKEHDNYEILLGIDGCEETLAKVKEIMHKYKNLKVMMMDKNVGTYVTCNTIMKEARYEWLLRFDSDDVMYPNMVETLMKKKGDAEFVLFQMRNFGLKKYKDEIQRAYGQHLMNRCVFYRFNGYANWICSADDDLIHKVRKYGKVIVIQEVLMKRRLHKNSLTINEKTNFESQIRKKYADIVLNNDTYSSLKKCKNNQIACYTFKKICPENIIVSFTSWKKRINCCSHIVDLMLKQTMCPNKIILNLSTDEFKNKELDLPKELLEKQNSIFEIYWVTKNTRVYKKIIPTLNRFPNDIIITVDDDIEYPSDYIETMYETYVYYGKKHPIAAFKNKEPNYDVYRHSGGFSLIKGDFFKNYLNELYDNVVLKNGIDVMENDDDIYFYASLLAKTAYKIVNDDYLLKINEIYKKSLALNSNPYSIYNDAWRKRREKSINILQGYIKETYKKTYDNLIFDLKEKIIVSFTTWKKRQESAAKMIEYFKKQTLKPDKIYCWLSSDEYNGENIPQCLKKFVDEKFIEVKWVNKNTYCHKRYEIFKEHYNDYVFLIDDDIYYETDYLEKMYNTAKDYKNNIICFCGNGIEITKERQLVSLKENPSLKNTILSGLSCYPPNVFPMEYFDYIDIRDKISPKCDDSFLCVLAIKNDIKTFCVYDRTQKSFKTIPNTQDVGIWEENKVVTNGVMKRTQIFKNLIKAFHLENECKKIWKQIVL